MTVAVPITPSGLTKVADTGAAGFALQNGTPTILTWTAPNDGNLHSAVVIIGLKVTATLAGGVVAPTLGGVVYNNQSGSNNYFFGGGNPTSGSSIFVPADGGLNNTFPVFAGTTFAIQQTSALTAGASIVYAQIWAA